MEPFGQMIQWCDMFSMAQAVKRSETLELLRSHFGDLSTVANLIWNSMGSG